MTDARSLKLASISSEIRFPKADPHLWPWPIDTHRANANPNARETR